MQSSYKNKNLKESAQTWNDKLELSDGLYFLSGIQDYFDYIIKEHEALTINPPIDAFQAHLYKPKTQLKIH